MRSVQRLRHILLIAGCVLLLHAAALWAMQTGSRHRTAKRAVPVQLLGELIEPSRPQVAPPSSSSFQQSRPRPRLVVRKTAPTRALLLPSLPLTVPDPAPAAPTGAAAPAPAPLPIAATAAAPAVLSASAASAASTAPPAPPTIELPSSSAAYLQNPKPNYPAASRNLGEQGRVVLRVLIGIDGTAQKVEIRQSSGYSRLDQAALNTVMRWRYAPGKRDGMIEAMWFNVPINFILD